MMDLVNETMAAGASIDSRDEEFKEISAEIEQLTARVNAIRDVAKSTVDNSSIRLKDISTKIGELEKGLTEYDDTVVRQIIECVRVYTDGTLEIIFGGGVTFNEQVPIISRKNNGFKKSSQ